MIMKLFKRWKQSRCKHKWEIMINDSHSFADALYYKCCHCGLEIKE